VITVQNFFKEGAMPLGVNDIAIVLIQKGNDPKELKDFLPISLCSVIYKLISRCLVNRLRNMLDDVISKE
jgi:hypothetical protein